MDQSATPPARATPDGSPLVVVANRLPVRLVDDPGPTWVASPGGLVSALTRVLHARGGLWVGWPGVTHPHVEPTEADGIPLASVPMTPEQYQSFYLGFSNATLWPLYHDAIRAPSFHRSWWESYVEVNQRFADVVVDRAPQGALTWIHDYQLQLVPSMIRERRPDLRVGFFLHIPFPPIELFMQLPWRTQIVQGLLGADLVGFQVPQAAANFSRAARRLLGTPGNDSRVHWGGRTIRVGAYPISVDLEQISDLVRSSEVQARARAIREELGNPERVLLGVGRLDYTKGMHQRLTALSELFSEGVLEPGRDVMIQIAVPSRESDPHYDRERRALERIVGEINGEHGRVGSPALHYLHQNLPFEELMALYLAADVMIVTPFRDGMNLVAKEFVASRLDLGGRLVLSEFAGAARELRAAYLVNPHDLDGLKETIAKALTDDERSARRRMARLRRQVWRRDVFQWADEFLRDLDDASQHAEQFLEGRDDEVGDPL